MRGLTFSLVSGEEWEGALHLRDDFEVGCVVAWEEVPSSRKTEKVVLVMTILSDDGCQENANLRRLGCMWKKKTSSEPPAEFGEGFNKLARYHVTSVSVVIA